MNGFRNIALHVLSLCAVFLLSACIKRIEPGIILYPTPHDNFVKINTDVRGVQLHYRQYPGESGDVVLIHGFASSTYTWDDMVPELQKRFKNSGKPCPRVWAVDLKGFGWSDKPPQAAYDPVTLANEVYIWMHAVGIDRATVAGNSLGGAIALILALDYPEKVERLVLIDAGGYPVDGANYTAFANGPFVRAGAQALFSRSIVKMVLRKAFYDESKVTDSRVDAYFNRLRTVGGVNSQIVMVTSFDPAQGRFYAQRIPDIQQETLILWGENDAWIPLKFGRQFKKDIKRSTLTVIPQSGHMPQEEKPAETAELLCRFLSGTQQKPAQ